jgi:hypothetical protein
MKKPVAGEPRALKEAVTVLPCNRRNRITQ